MKKPRDPSEYSPYGKRLDQAMRHAGIDQAELVKRTKIAQGTVSGAFVQAGTKSTATYAKACGVDAYWLETGLGAMVSAVPTSTVTPIANAATSPYTIVKSLAALLAKLGEDELEHAQRLLEKICKGPADAEDRIIKLAAWLGGEAGEEDRSSISERRSQ